jgi:hypothetical protein
MQSDVVQNNEFEILNLNYFQVHPIKSEVFRKN